MNEDFTFNNKYSTDSTGIQQQNVNTQQNGYTQKAESGFDYSRQFRPQPQAVRQEHTQPSGYQSGWQQSPTSNGYQSNGQQYTQPSSYQSGWQQSPTSNGYQYNRQQYPEPTQNPNFCQRPFDLGKEAPPNSNAYQPNGAYQNNNSYQSNTAYPNNGGYPSLPVYAPPNNDYYRYYYAPSPKEVEKTAVKKSASFAGKSTLVIFLVMQGLALILYAIAMACGIVDFSASDSDPYMGFTATGYYLYSGVLSLVSAFIPTLILIKFSGSKMEELVPFKRVEGKKLAAIVMGGMALCMIAQIIAALLDVNLSLFGIDVYAGMESETATGVFDIIMQTICTAIIPALVEEFAYRGLVTGVLKKHGDLFAILTSAFLFGMLHGNLAQIPFAFVVGLVLGYARVKTDSMLPSILIHFGNNFYAVIMTSLTETLSETMGTILSSVIMIVLLVAGFVAISYLAKNHKDFFNMKDKESLLTFKEKIKAFFSSGVVIADVVVLSVCAFSLLLLM